MVFFVEAVYSNQHDEISDDKLPPLVDSIKF